MFGLGFTEILIIAVIAILFLGPDKLPSAMVEVAKFFRNAKNTIGDVKDSIEQEINVSEIKAEALAYKKELLDAQEKLNKVTEMTDVKAQLSNFGDDIMGSIDDDLPTPNEKKETLKSEKVAFDKKNKIKEDSNNV